MSGHVATRAVRLNDERQAQAGARGCSRRGASWATALALEIGGGILLAASGARGRLVALDEEWGIFCCCF
jgi:hypothetical protein